MTNDQVTQITEAITRLAQGPVSGECAQPGGMEAIVLAMAGGFKGTGGDSIADGLHDVADALRSIADAIHDSTCTRVAE